jgi:hypothetical protein
MSDRCPTKKMFGQKKRFLYVSLVRRTNEFGQVLDIESIRGHVRNFARTKTKFLNSWILEFLNSWILEFLNSFFLSFLSARVQTDALQFSKISPDPTDTRLTAERDERLRCSKKSARTRPLSQTANLSLHFTLQLDVDEPSKMRKDRSSSKRSPPRTRSYSLRNPQSPPKERVDKNDRRTNSRSSRASSCSLRSVLSDLLFEELSENISQNVFIHEETNSHGDVEKKENEEGTFTRTSMPPAAAFEVAEHEDITGSSGPFSFLFFETNANFSFIYCCIIRIWTLSSS